MRIKPHGDGGRIITGDTPWGRWSITLGASASGKPLRIIDGNGVEVGTASVVITHPMPDDHDPAQEAARMTQGGCCGQASE